MEFTLFEILEILMIIGEGIETLKENSDNEAIPPEVSELLVTLADDEVGNNSLELILDGVNNALMNEETEQSYIETVSTRLDTIDQRLDSEFLALNDCLGFISTALVFFIMFKLLSWFYSVISR